MFQPKLVLHPTDFSDLSRYSFKVAVDLAEKNKATLLVVHVIDPLGPESVTSGTTAPAAEAESYRRRLEADLKRLAAPPETDLLIEYLLAEGDPAEEITRVARDQHCDLIVLGTHGRTGLLRLLMGSTAEEVIRRAPCPVLVCKAPPAESPPPAT